MGNQISSLHMGQKFKRTPVGEIPVDWEVTTFGDSFQFLRTANNARSDLNTYEKVGYLHYGDLHMKWQTKLRCDRVELPKIHPSKVQGITRLQDGDLVMADASEDYEGIGVAVEISGQGQQEIVAGLHTILLRDKEKTFADGFRGYIQYIPGVHERIREVATGVSVYGLSKRNLMGVSIPRPPIQEQKKIAEILSAVDDAIEKTTAIIKTTEKFKKIIARQIFRYGFRGGRPMKSSPIGKVPQDWKVVTLREVCEKIQDGTHFSPKSKDGPYMYVTSKNIRMGHLDLTDIGRISEEEHRDIFKRANVMYGDVLLTKDGAKAGNIAVNTIQEPFSLLSSVAFIRPNKKLAYSDWIYHFFASDEGQRLILGQISGNAITRLTLTKIKGLMVPIAPLKEQNQIIDFLSSIENVAKDDAGFLEKAKMLKSALMGILLNGKIRVRIA